MSSQPRYKRGQEVEAQKIEEKIEGIKESLLLFERHLPTAHQCVKEFLTEYVVYLKDQQEILERRLSLLSL